MCITHTTTGSHSDLDGVPAWLTHLFQVQRLVGGFVVSSLNRERSRVDTHLRKRKESRRRRKKRTRKRRRKEEEEKKRRRKRTRMVKTKIHKNKDQSVEGQTWTEAGQLVFICRSSWW